MDPRLGHIGRKLAQVPYAPLRSHSFGEQVHRFRLDAPLSRTAVAEFEAGHGIELPGPYRGFLTTLGGGAASPFYGLLSLQSCELRTMDPPRNGASHRGFSLARPPCQDDLFLHIIEAGCSDLVLLGITGPLTGRIVTGNSEGYREPTVSSAPDFLAWYERWLDHMLAGRDNPDLALTSPALRAARSTSRNSTVAEQTRTP
ncbi:SMI1/KNR4 family protein [Actinoalloteichus hymeniacidonis]|uniref:Knr4/Smi1-like domain-containing protein n=1 Tax=Actinoalloteichus hymeniacidonis TaxID=340345 RepID=A0AAC9HVF1_9PSEU|nr:SMI1/KNR4 family protein [Actinoalloteichus hymeniacidonis]AOS66143.1 hypothetical protein TL08_26875 [Actinoalloteichus hymeniacidonis]MBB5905754.1 hypothetical protein [Actinoalloteichus hymeniacidonis]